MVLKFVPNYILQGVYYLFFPQAQSQSPQGLLVLQVLLALQAHLAHSPLLRCTITSIPI